ncbi:MAG: amidohydrolase [Phycisphaerae bacterium]|nr:amidohydrolase [Gemmatimonadaceae bacterium]
MPLIRCSTTASRAQRSRRVASTSFQIAAASILLATTAVAQTGAGTTSGRPIAQPADLIVTNARVYTADNTHPLAEAFAVRGARIVFIGSAREAQALRGPSTKVVDAAGRTVIPGMVDAHAHLGGLAQSLRNVDLTGTRTYDEVIARVAERARTLPKGAWVQGRGWDQNDWGDTRFPTHEKLTAALPDNPVVLTRVDGHAVLVNAAAMRAAGISATTADPSGGRILRDAANNPTGVLVDNAQALAGRTIPAPRPEEIRSAVKDAVAELHRWGLTGLHDAGANRAQIDLYESLAKAGELDLRLDAMISDDSAAISHYFAMGPRSGLYDGRLWVRSVKLYADGALGSRGAALLEPYSDDPNNTGLLVSAPAHIREVAERALKTGFQVNTHAIGDRGNRIVLDAYEAALKAVPTADHRFRVEHAQIIAPDDIPRFAQLGVIPSMQASHQTSDMYWAEKRIGQTRLLGAYAWQSLIASGVVIPNGSDAPVEQVNPLISFHASIARQDANNWPAGGWFAEQRMSREDGLRSMTLWPAYAAFQEKDLGSLTVGKLADFVILDQDIMRVPPELVLKTNVLNTYVGGKEVYVRKTVP